MNTLAQEARRLAETTEERSTESARSLYCELLRRRDKPRRDDAAVLGETCRVLNVPISEFERDAATVANSMFRAHRYGPEHPALQGRDLDPSRHANLNRLYAGG